MRENIFKKPAKANVTLNKSKNIIKIFNKILVSKLDPKESQAFCFGYVLALSMYTDIGQDNISELNTYIKSRGGIRCKVR